MKHASWHGARWECEFETRRIVALWSYELPRLTDMSRIVSDKELNLVLVQLLDFLGHRNTIVSAFAFNEVCGEEDFTCDPKRSADVAT